MTGRQNRARKRRATKKLAKWRVRKDFALAVSELQELGLSRAYIERVLGLPQRTLTKILARHPLPHEIALIKMIHRMPWLLDVAQDGFNPRKAAAHLVIAAGHVMLEAAE